MSLHHPLYTSLICRPNLSPALGASPALSPVVLAQHAFLAPALHALASLPKLFPCLTQALGSALVLKLEYLVLSVANLFSARGAESLSFSCWTPSQDRWFQNRGQCLCLGARAPCHHSKRDMVKHTAPGNAATPREGVLPEMPGGPGFKPTLPSTGHGLCNVSQELTVIINICLMAVLPLVAKEYTKSSWVSE